MRTVFFLVLGYLIVSVIIFISYVTIEIIFDEKYINYTLLLKEAFVDMVFPYFIIVLFKGLLSKRN
ncbi:hypothetical protein OQ257_01890 [Actinobacillus equuli subsp. equuli]|uniref:Uncharacterized protein n=1 Tax=Actinobacillus equuli subsp. equuli TaxID=202947 RepID=A0A9X4G298_ACTEU|nr:hypothetical protein [Actinobacillus equuli]MDE8033923.1 hypothetical protein [Actinobacillus equuli subsp. equuli]MDG4948035.1 hypothetical protein [Actinobacillus equuli subsp. haemolyticus]